MISGAATTFIMYWRPNTSVAYLWNPLSYPRSFWGVSKRDVANKILTKAMTAQARNRRMKIYMDNSSVAASENILLYTRVEEINIDVKINVEEIDNH